MPVSSQDLDFHYPVVTKNDLLAIQTFKDWRQVHEIISCIIFYFPEQIIPVSPPVTTMPPPPPPMTQLAVPLQPPPVFHQPPMVAFNGHMTETPPLPHMNIPVACLGMEGQPPPLPPHMMNGAMVPFNGENGMMGRPDNMTNPVVYVPYMETIMPTEVNVDYPPSEDSRGLDLPLNGKIIKSAVVAILCEMKKKKN